MQISNKAKSAENIFYQTVLERSRHREGLIATVTGGEHCGQKAYLEDGVLRAVIGDFFLPGILHEITNHAGADSFLVFDQDEIFIQPVGNHARIVLCGGGHVAMALIRMAKYLDFEIWVIEDRPLFAEHARRQGADHVICSGYAEGLRQVPESPDNYFVCMTRGHRFDRECLEEIFQHSYAYAGMMGSKLRSGMVRKELRECGFSPEITDSLHAPIGLDIGAETPEEIALAVMGEIVQKKNQLRRDRALDEEILSKLLEHTHSEDSKPRMILCTIVSKRGSAPRGVGTQMLVTSDHQITGTIGGGCKEAEVIARCRRQFLQPVVKDRHFCEKMDVMMTADETEEEGMVCGGWIQVFLEEIP